MVNKDLQKSAGNDRRRAWRTLRDEFGGHSRGRMNFGVSVLAKTAFLNDVTITSSLHSVVQVSMGRFTIFSHTDCQDDSCQKL